jgi:hypothetical protein
MSIAVRPQDSALAQVNRARPEVREARPPSGTERRATSLLGSRLMLNAGYYVAHPDPARAESDPEDEKRGNR